MQSEYLRWLWTSTPGTYIEDGHPIKQLVLKNNYWQTNQKCVQGIHQNQGVGIGIYKHWWPLSLHATAPMTLSLSLWRASAPLPLGHATAPRTRHCAYDTMTYNYTSGVYILVRHRGLGVANAIRNTNVQDSKLTTDCVDYLSAINTVPFIKQWQTTELK